MSLVCTRCGRPVACWTRLLEPVILVLSVEKNRAAGANKHAISCCQDTVSTFSLKMDEIDYDAEIARIRAHEMRELSRVRHDSLRRYFVVRDAIVRGAIANVHAADQYCANILAQARSEIRLIKLESFTQRRRLRERQKRERDAELWI